MSSENSRGPDRRQFVALGLGAFVVASLPLAARRRDRLVRRTLPVMGTLAEIALVHRDVARANVAIDAAMQELQRVERTMTRFDVRSDIGRANVVAARAPVAVSAETALVVAEALRWADASGGAYDPAIGDIVRLWDVAHRHSPPGAERVAALAGRQLHRMVEVDAGKGGAALRFHDPDVQLDLGGIAKGYGVDRAVDALRRCGLHNALVSVGGDLYALGSGPDGDAWQVGIQDPDDTRALIGTVRVSDAAVATSGTYQQYFRYRGKRYHHLMDPDTGAPRATSVQSLTIMADTCMHADVAATAVFGMRGPDAERVLARCAPGARSIRTA